jgi:hypothetical protein
LQGRERILCLDTELLLDDAETVIVLKPRREGIPDFLNVLLQTDA